MIFFNDFSIFISDCHPRLFLEQLEAPELKLTGPNKLGKVEYFQHLRNAKFCLSPRGESSWTLRFYEAFFVVIFHF